jgi:4-amino-4-deoxy-L-arabinose transferase-like glycosyltransferase
VQLGYWDRDEAEYAGVAHGMAQSGDFLVPRLFGKLYPDKPPLSEWLSALDFRLLGETEISGRLPHILLAVGACVLILVIGNRLFGLRKGALASLLFATSFLFIIYGRLLLTDAALVFFTLLTVSCLLTLLEERGRLSTVLTGGAALGFALLAKGPIAYLAPFLFLGGYSVARRGLSRPAAKRIAGVFGVSAIVGFPWFLLTARETGGESLTTFLLRENWNRFLHPMEGHGGAILYFLVILAFGFFPWSGLLLVVKKSAFRREPARWGLFAWGCGVLAFFSFSATKLPHYLLPALPAFALLLADAFDAESRNKIRLFAWATALTGLLLFLGVLYAARQWDLLGIAGNVIWPFAVVATLSLAFPLLSSDERTRRLVVPLGVVVSATIAVWVPRALDSARCLPKLGATTKLFRKTAEPLGGLKIEEPALGYYAGCVAAEYWVSADQVVRSALKSPTRSTLVWLEAADGIVLARDRRSRIRVLAAGFNLIDPTSYGELELCRVTAPDLRAIQNEEGATGAETQRATVARSKRKTG